MFLREKMVTYRLVFRFLNVTTGSHFFVTVVLLCTAHGTATYRHFAHGEFYQRSNFNVHILNVQCLTWAT